MDETMSQDVAFTSENMPNDVFKFDEVEKPTPASQAETGTTDTKSSSSEAEVVEEQKVPYSRFKKKVDELEEYAEKVSTLEERLSELEKARTGPADDVTPDAEWVQLYGNSDVAKEAYKVQLRREEQLEERAMNRAVESLRRQASEETNQLAENEATIDDNLEDLQKSIGRKLTAKQEEEVLSIVDEFSPTGSDGKYVSLFPFDKAYEIYSLRSSQKGASTRQAREAIAGLSSAPSQGEADGADNPFKRGWDNWREAL